MKKIALIIAPALALVLLGASCNTTQNTTQETQTKPADNQTSTDNNTTPSNSGSIVLKAEALGNGQVKFEWTVPEQLKSEEGYAILRGTEPNPTYPSTYWYLMGSAHREKVWGGLPTGTAHFRICQYKNNTCAGYSNDVEVEVK